MFSKIYFKALALPALIVAIYTAVIMLFVSPKIAERAIYLEEKTGKAHLQEIATVVDSTARELKSYHKSSIIQHKNELKNVTDVAFTLVNELYTSSQPESIRKQLLSEARSFKKNLTVFYQRSLRDSSPEEIRQSIKNFIMLHRYNNGSGYFFINKGTSSVLHPIEPELEGKDLKDLKDQDGVYFIREFARIAREQKEGFVSYKWINPKSGRIEKKLSYVFYFEPFDWIIGTGVYTCEITREMKKKAIDYVARLRYGKNEYFYISTYDSILISHPTLQGRDMSRVKDPEGILIVPPLVKIARERGEGFHSYSWSKLDGNGELYKKLTFAKLIPNWEWIIGTGMYLDSVERQVKVKKLELVKNLRKLLTNTKIADTGYIYIFDAKGNMILHPNSNIEGKNFLTLKNPGKDSFIFDDLVKAYKSGEKVLYYLWDKPNDKGNYVYDKVSWITYNKDFDWYICSSAYLAEINSTANKLKKYFWIISFILLSLSLFISAYFLKRLVSPIETLSRKALQVKNGDLTVRSRFRANDEIGTLAQTFDSMLDTIEENIRTLDRKVAERTEDLEEMVRKLDFLASHDPMTGIYNRRKFFELAEEQFSRDPTNLYAAMIDIDNFKKINDSYGHPTGDLVIRTVTASIAEVIQPDAVLGRLGGEEFAILCRYPVQQDVMKQLELIRKKVAALEIITDTSERIQCTISIGVVKADEDTGSLDELLHRADKFLYKAKGLGRNKTVFRI